MGDMLSQAEIDALLGDDLDEDAIETGGGLTLSDEQKDVLGEIENICMGTSAAALHSLLGQKVAITMPRIEVMQWSALPAGFGGRCVGVRANYTKGLQGANLLLLKEADVKAISNLMMGGDGVEDTQDAVDDTDLSAIAEAVGQMMGSASASLSKLMQRQVEVEKPLAFASDMAADVADCAAFVGQTVVRVSFRIEVGTLVDSSFVQVLPYDFAVDMADIMERICMEGQPMLAEAGEEAALVSEAVAAVPEAEVVSMAVSEPIAIPSSNPTRMAASEPVAVPEVTPVTVPKPMVQEAPRQTALQRAKATSAQFQSFGNSSGAQERDNIGMIMDVPLEVTAELGRSSKTIKEILSLTPGSILELDRMAGEPVDIMVNGKFIAKGEVVVIEESFAVRVTEIVQADKRI